MADIWTVYDPSGAEIGDIPISPQQFKQLQNDATITIMWHTPRMLAQALGSHNGTFEVHRIGSRLTVNDPEQARRYIELQLDIARAMKQPDKWTDPDAESDSPIR